VAVPCQHPCQRSLVWVFRVCCAELVLLCSVQVAHCNSNEHWVRSQWQWLRAVGQSANALSKARWES
jgi:hypothetical protein